MNEPLMEYHPQVWVGRDGQPHPLVHHEAGHALVAHRLGMRVEHVDMTGAHAPCPSCGLDETSVPSERRARAVGLAALAGPVAESLEDGEPPRWRADRPVAAAAARELTTSVADQTELLLKWQREARSMLERDSAFEPLVQRLAECGRLTGEEFATFMREVDGMRYSMEEHGGHLFTEVEGRRYLVDTGSPCSFGSGPLTLAGREFVLAATDPMGNSAASLGAMVGTAFDGLLGADVLGAFDLEVSLRDRELRLSEAPFSLRDATPVTDVQGVPLVTFEVNGRATPMFLDTGAQLSYVNEECSTGCSPLGEVEDFHPLLGRFTVPTFAVPVRVAGQTVSVRAGRMPMLLEMALGVAGADGVLGTEVLQHGVLRLSHRQRRMALLPYAGQE